MQTLLEALQEYIKKVEAMEEAAEKTAKGYGGQHSAGEAKAYSYVWDDLRVLIRPYEILDEVEKREEAEREAQMERDIARMEAWERPE